MFLGIDVLIMYTMYVYIVYVVVFIVVYLCVTLGFLVLDSLIIGHS